MKRFVFLYLSLFVALVLCAQNREGAHNDSILKDMDSVEVSLITCSPHTEVYSLYGHSALRYHNLRTGYDAAFNWGIFSFKKPFFALRFAFGLNDYELGVYAFQDFCRDYRRRGSQIVEQVLDLTTEEKYRLSLALTENMQPQNVVYRYNEFYDNCSTRPRDMIEKCLSGELLCAERPDYQPTYREIVHQCTRSHQWLTFGIDLLLGVKADKQTTLKEQEFLPNNLMYDFDRAQVYATGNYRTLVKERRLVAPAKVQMQGNDFPLSPTECACILLAVALAITGMEWKRKKISVWWDVVLMTVTGIAGIIVFAMFFSEHPFTSTNLQVLLLSPLPLFFLPSVARRKPTNWWNLSLILIVLFMLGAFFQDYAEGMEIVALCLLTRIWSNKKHAK